MAHYSLSHGTGLLPNLAFRTIKVLRSTGVDELAEEEAVKRVVLVNTLSLSISLTMILLAPIITWLIPKAVLIVPMFLEFAVNASVMLLNQHKKYNAAALTLYFNQCVFILYFCFLLGNAIQLQFMIIFLILMIHSIIKGRSWREVCLWIAMLTLIALQLGYYYNIHFLPVSPVAGFVIQTGAVIGVFSLILLAREPYMSSYDANFQLKRADQFKTMFVYQITHELRTPLFAIRMELEALESQIKSDKSLRKVERSIDKMVAAARSMHYVIDNVQDMAKIESGQLDLEEKVQPFPVKSFFRNIVELHKVLARSGRSIDLNLSFDRMPMVIFGDTLKLQQITTNLLTNAIKYSYDESTVHIKISAEQGSWTLAISNEGKGIAADKLESIFDPFVTEGSGLGTQSASTGLGLYITKSKVESLKGHISVASEPGKTTTFAVTLPLRAGSIEDLDPRDKEEERTEVG